MQTERGIHYEQTRMAWTESDAGGNRRVYKAVGGGSILSKKIGGPALTRFYSFGAAGKNAPDLLCKKQHFCQ